MATPMGNVRAHRIADREGHEDSPEAHHPDMRWHDFYIASGRRNQPLAEFH
jgi:hypothetical protein